MQFAAETLVVAISPLTRSRMPIARGAERTWRGTGGRHDRLCGDGAQGTGCVIAIPFVVDFGMPSGQDGREGSL